MVDAAPVYYRTVDPIGNLQLRVVLRCVDPGSHGPRRRGSNMSQRAGSASGRRDNGSTDGDGGEDSKGVEGSAAPSVANGSVTNGDVNSANPGQTWMQTLSWQAKVFGPQYVCVSCDAWVARATLIVCWHRRRELLKFGLLKDQPHLLKDQTRVNLEYINQLDRETTNRFDPTVAAPVYLHTFVDRDGYVPPEDFEKRVTDADTGLPYLAEGVLKLPMRGVSTAKTGAAATEQAHLFRDAPFKTWYLMATVEVDVCVPRRLCASHTESELAGRGFRDCVAWCGVNSDEFVKKNKDTQMSSHILCVIKSYTHTNLLEMTVCMCLC